MVKTSYSAITTPDPFPPSLSDIHNKGQPKSILVNESFLSGIRRFRQETVVQKNILNIQKELNAPISLESEANLALERATTLLLLQFVEDSRITKKDHEMILFLRMIDSMNPLFAAQLKEEFENDYTPKEKLSAYEAQNLLHKELFKYASKGLYPDGKPGGNVNISRMCDVNPYDFPKLNHTAIGFINGMDNQLNDAKAHAIRLSDQSKNAIHLIYNATHGKANDLIQAICCEVLGLPSSNESLLLLQWEEFFETYGPDAKFLQICHSKGAIHVKNALNLTPPSLRNRIVVLSIAPAAIILPHECLKAYQYVSDSDKGIKALHQGFPERVKHLETLKPHPNAIGMDHFLNSLTYQEKIKDVIDVFLEKWEKKK